MSKFKIGDEVTLKKDNPWYQETFIGERGNPPKFGEVYPVLEIDYYAPFFYVTLVGLSKTDCWNENAFEKVVSDSVLREQLESVPEPFTL